MAASSFVVPAPCKQRLFAKADNLTSGGDTLSMRLLSSAAALGAATGATAQQLSSFTGTSGLAKWADVSANEVAGTGYTAGGQVLTGVSVFYYVAGVYLNAGGSGGTAGPVTLSLTGGTQTSQATFSGTITGGALTAVSGIVTCGNYSVLPALNAPGTTSFAVTGGGLTGATVEIVWGMAFTCNNPSWPNSTITAKYAAIVDNTDANLPILAICDLETTLSSGVSSINGPLTINIPAASGASPGGVLTLQ